MANSKIPSILKRYEAELLEEWLRAQQSANRSMSGQITDNELRTDAAGFLRQFVSALQKGNVDDIYGKEWNEIRDQLGDLSRSRARLGFTPAETATFVFSFKRPLFDRLRVEIKDVDTMAAEIWAASTVIDELGLFTIEAFQKTREDVINRQQQELLELSTPVTRLWDGILAVPLIGTLDSARTQVVMESLLQEVVNTGASIAVMDITGVSAVDTLVAQHLLKTVAAARLMGAECIISGIRPQIAQTIVHLGVDLGDVVTKATLADALRHALGRLGLQVVPIETLR